MEDDGIFFYDFSRETDISYKNAFSINGRFAIWNSLISFKHVQYHNSMLPYTFGSQLDKAKVAGWSGGQETLEKQIGKVTVFFFPLLIDERPYMGGL